MDHFNLNENSKMKKAITPFNLLIALFIASFSSAMAIDTAGEKENLIADFERAKAYSLDYLNAMPADGYAYKPTEDTRSFAQQFLHLAGANYFFTSTIIGADNPKAGIEFEKLDEFQSKIACTKAVAESYDYVIETLKGMTNEALAERIKMFGQFVMTRAIGFDKAFEHGAHHRGQTTIYLRLKGVTPPQEKLF
jgi:uncharacterized damage-inducible protein DinB